MRRLWVVGVGGGGVFVECVGVYVGGRVGGGCGGFGGWGCGCGGVY